MTDVCAEKRTKCTVTLLVVLGDERDDVGADQDETDDREPEPRLEGLARLGVDPLAAQSHGRESTRRRAALRARAGGAG